jgi:uncharacterized protein (TIGR02646 family)
MRPVRRGLSPRGVDFVNYEDAKPELVARMGHFCSYCERYIATGLAVEHIQPKALPQYAGLIGRWENFLLACVNCNGSKGHKDVRLAEILLPDRDNTYAAFIYAEDGTVSPRLGLNDLQRTQAIDTLSLTGLDKAIDNVLDQNGKLVAFDRVSQRMQAWIEANLSKVDIQNDPGNQPLREGAVRLARGVGFFSIWMTVFTGDLDMRNRLIDAFSGTRESHCFDAMTGEAINAQNPDGLLHGGKF